MNVKYWHCLIMNPNKITESAKVAWRPAISISLITDQYAGQRFESVGGTAEALYAVINLKTFRLHSH